MFDSVSGKTECEHDDMIPGMDESKMEKAMAMLASEAEKINEEDPRQAAQLMKKLSDATGMKMGGAMEEALCRMERGEDPETIEQEMGNAFENEEPFSFEGRKVKSAKQKALNVDDTLYDL